MCARACLQACVWVPDRVGLYMSVRACSLANPACNALGVELFYADRQTDGHDEANCRFSHFIKDVNI